MILSNYAIKFRTAVFVLLALLAVVGYQSYRDLPREGSPDITIPYVFVTALYEGTAPAEMEKLVTSELEKRFNDLEGVKEIRSTTAEGVATLAIEFLAGQNIDRARQRVKDKVDLARPDLPEDLDEPVVDAFNFSSDVPIFILALSGATDLERLKRLAEDLQEDIERLPGVKEAAIVGAREREIRVELDLRRLAAFDVPIGAVLGRIARENVNVSAGNLEIRGNKFQVRVPGEYKLAGALAELPVLERGGRTVFLRDIATVADTFKDRSSISRLNGEPSVSLHIKKRSGENSVAVIEQVKRILEQSPLPPGLRRTAVFDESEYVEMMIAELENNILSGFVLVVAVLVIFMGWRNSLFVALAIPYSMLIAFTIMRGLGASLNMIVLFGLVMAVGMLVDNGVVIVENIYRLHCSGLSRDEAARRGAAEVAWPVITSTLTTLAAFAPLLYWPDIMGQFMSFLPWTLIVTLTASLFVALVVNPALCSVLVARGGGPDAGPARPHAFMRAYEALLRGAIAHRVPVLLIGGALLVLTLLVYVRFGAGVELFPESEPRNAKIQLTFPQGTALETTDEALRRLEPKLTAYEDIEFFLTSVGEGAGTMFSTSQGTHQGTIHVEFVDFAHRRRRSAELVDELRDAVGTIPGAEVTVEKEREGPPTGAPVAIELSGDDFDELSRVSAEIVRALETVPGLVDLRDDFEEALPELQFHVDRDRAALFGLDTRAVGDYLRAAIYGLESSKLRVDEDEFDITVRLPLAQRNSVALLEQAFIPVAGGGRVALSALGQIVYAGGRGAIRRTDQKRMITITGNNRGRGVDKILIDVKARVSRLALPPGYVVKYAGDNEEMVKSGKFLLWAFGMAVGLIAIILVIQFNSAVLPVIIMVSVLLSLIGVMWGLLICGLRFGVVMTGLGVISLAGVVVNNSIVLIDCIRQRREEGLDAVEAAVAAGRLRLRPVLLTAGTTVLGLIPMAIGWSVEVHAWPPRFVAGAESSQWWAPMAVAVIFGLATATLLTLIQVPVMYTMADSVAAAFKRWFGVKPEPMG